MRRLRLTISGALIGLCAMAAYAVAQGAPPTVNVTVSRTATAVQVPGPVPAGPTKMQVTRQGTGDAAAYFLLLNAGVTREEFEAAIRQDDRTDGTSAVGLVSIQGSVSLDSAATRAVTFTLRPGLTYLVMGEVSRGDDRPPVRSFTTLTTTGAQNGAAAPAPEATIPMRGLRFRGDTTLPRQGSVRFVNADGVPHFALGFPLRRGTTNRQLGRAVRSPSEAAFRRISAGPPLTVQSFISGGNVTNDTEVRFPRGGRYGLVCFFDGHERLGMYRVVTVR
jgi:hypothetical protein